MKVLSLFDGISTGQYALKSLGINVEKYYASEIEENVIAITQYNYPDTEQLGDVCNIDFADDKFKDIDLLIGGSPCQSLSITQSKTRQGLDGKSKLFFEYVRAFETIRPKWFLLENVESMSDECKEVITSLMGYEPLMINAGDFSAQIRKRYFWTNIPVNMNYNKSELVLKDILQDNVEEKYFYTQDYDFHGNDNAVCGTLHINGHDILKRIQSVYFKCPTLTCCTGGNKQKKILDNNRCRKLTPVEYERLQSLPDNYTQYGMKNGKVVTISNTARYNACGNGWNANVIKHIFSYLT